MSKMQVDLFSKNSIKSWVDQLLPLDRIGHPFNGTWTTLKHLNRNSLSGPNAPGEQMRTLKIKLNDTERKLIEQALPSFVVEVGVL